MVDPSLKTRTINWEEVEMCIQLGLLCCQASVADRPEMNSVHLMLMSHPSQIPKPGKPGIHGRRGRWATSSSTSFTSNNKTDDHTNTTTTTTISKYNYSNTSSLDDYRT